MRADDSGQAELSAASNAPRFSPALVEERPASCHEPLASPWAQPQPTDYVQHSEGPPADQMHLYPIDGAVHRKRPDETAWTARGTTWSMVIVGLSPDAGDVPTIKDWAKNYLAAVHPHNLAGAYPNFMMDDEGDARVRASFGMNYDQLAELKRKYDPGNLFKVNQNILPAN